jgi:hypothetical protein
MDYRRIRVLRIVFLYAYAEAFKYSFQNLEMVEKTQLVQCHKPPLAGSKKSWSRSLD